MDGSSPSPDSHSAPSPSQFPRTPSPRGSPAPVSGSSPSPQHEDSWSTDANINLDLGLRTGSNPSSRYARLRFTVRFPQRDPQTFGGGRNDTPTQRDTQLQAFSITFHPDFAPSSLTPIDLQIDGHGITHHTYTPIPSAAETAEAVVDPHDEYRPANFDTCVIKEPIDLFQPPPRRYPPWHRLLLMTAAFAIIVALFASSFRPPPPLSYPSASSATSPIRIRHMPLRVFENLMRLLQQHAVAPLPIVSTVQDCVDKHYLLHPKPPGMTENNLNMTVNDFLSHVYLASSGLCATTRAWSSPFGLSTPLHKDLVFLCRQVSQAALDVSPRWTQAASEMSSTWPSSSTFAVDRLLRLLERYFPEKNPNVDDDMNHRDASEHNNDRTPNEAPRFYNQTSHNLLYSMHNIFFNDETQSGTPSAFGVVVYEAADNIDLLQHTITRVVVTLSLLLELIRSNVLDEARVQKLRHDDRSHGHGHGARWFGGGTTTLNSTELALARIAPAYDEVLPLLHTLFILPWVIGFSRSLIESVVADLEMQGNYTLSLLATSPPPQQQEATKGIQEALDWWRGSSWVTERRESTGSGRPQVLTRTYHYLPALEPVFKQFRGFSNWISHQASRSREQWDWWKDEVLRDERDNL